MSKLYKCDVCGKCFESVGFSIDVRFIGELGFEDVARYRFDVGQKEICKDCYDKFVAAIKEKEVSN